MSVWVEQKVMESEVSIVTEEEYQLDSTVYSKHSQILDAIDVSGRAMIPQQSNSQ